jgi:beta-lactam-binding protein with PASTA domain
VTSAFGRAPDEQPADVPGGDASPTYAVTPDLIDLELQDACAAAAWAGTRISATPVTRSRGPWGVVVAQSPSPGTRLRTLWQIHVLVSTALPAEEADDA